MWGVAGVCGGVIFSCLSFRHRRNQPDPPVLLYFCRPRERTASSGRAPDCLFTFCLRGPRATRRGSPQNRRNRPSSLSCTSYSPLERTAPACIALRPILLKIASPGPARSGTAKKGKNKSSQIAPTSSVSSRSTWLYIVHRGAELIIFLQDEVFAISKLRKLYDYYRKDSCPLIGRSVKSLVVIGEC